MKSRCLTILFGLLLACWPAAAGAESIYLLSVGNNQGHSGEVQLKYAERDANKFANVLKRLGNVRAQDAIVMLGDEGAKITAALRTLNGRIGSLSRAGRSDAILLVFYSGHADARGLHPGDSTVSYKTLRKLIRASKARLRVLIIDGCRSGGLTRVKGAKSAPSFNISTEGKLRTRGMVIITSSAAGEDSHESERLQASFFSHHLTNALRGVADRNRDGRISLAEAYGYTYHQTLRSSGKTMSLQHPTFEHRLRGRGDIVLTQPSRNRRSGRLQLADPGVYLVRKRSEKGPVVSEIETSRKSVKLTLPPGRYFVQERASTFYREYDVKLSAGKTLALAGQQSRTVA